MSYPGPGHPQVGCGGPSVAPSGRADTIGGEVGKGNGATFGNVDERPDSMHILPTPHQVWTGNGGLL